MANITARVLQLAGLSKSMAYHAISGKRTISVPLALWLLESDGIKVGPLEGMTARQIDTLRSVHKASAPKSVIERRAANANTPPRSEAA